jgi:hypothetical protein
VEPVPARACVEAKKAIEFLFQHRLRERNRERSPNDPTGQTALTAHPGAKACSRLEVVSPVALSSTRHPDRAPCRSSQRASPSETVCFRAFRDTTRRPENARATPNGIRLPVRQLAVGQQNKINQTQFFLDEGIDFTKTRLLATTLLSGAL